MMDMEEREDVDHAFHHYNIFRRNARSKGKQKVVEKTKKFTLVLVIHNADGIDPPSVYPSLPLDARSYAAVAWVNPGEECVTCEGFGLCPEWNQKYLIPLGSFLNPMDVLKVEVVRLQVGSQDEPSPSTGQLLVGKAEIPLPTGALQRMSGRFGLVRLEGQGRKPEGHIGISMKIVESLQ